MTIIDPQAPILVTGASGYVAGWLIKDLLAAGHTVHGTVRDPDKTSSVAHLRQMDQTAPGTLKLFQADLLQEGSFAEAMAGCQVVMHTASPFILTGITDPQEQLVRPALLGTENVLETANQTDSVRRVVLTSSVVATVGDAMDLRESGKNAITEDDWNTTSNAEHQPYAYSKTVAERRAWEMVNNQDRWDLVTINPGAVFGPSLAPGSKSASIDLLVQLGDGRAKMGVPALELGIVDVRDVAQAHIQAAFRPEAKGRYLTCNTSLTLMQMANILRGRYAGDYPFPTRTLPKPLVWLAAPMAGLTRDYVSRNVGFDLRFDNTRSKEDLGLGYYPAEQTLVEHFEQLAADHRV
ncbi:MAG: aldehyde reductase [Actinomycetia bacterium]|nr:aldehyde reductase [Actinomycetes bacterium]